MIPLDMEFYIVDLTYTHSFPKPHSFTMHPCTISKKVLSTWKHLTILITFQDQDHKLLKAWLTAPLKQILIAGDLFKIAIQVKLTTCFQKYFSTNNFPLKIKTMVFCYQNCSDLLWEKIVLVIEKNFWNSRLKAKNLQNFWDH